MGKRKKAERTEGQMERGMRARKTETERSDNGG